MPFIGAMPGPAPWNIEPEYFIRLPMRPVQACLPDNLARTLQLRTECYLV
jgi:hypothetical protein